MTLQNTTSDIGYSPRVIWKWNIIPIKMSKDFYRVRLVTPKLIRGEILIVTKKTLKNESNDGLQILKTKTYCWPAPIITATPEAKAGWKACLSPSGEVREPLFSELKINRAGDTAQYKDPGFNP